MKNRTSYGRRKSPVVGCQKIKTTPPHTHSPVHLEPLLFCRGGQGSLEAQDVLHGTYGEQIKPGSSQQYFLFMVLFKDSQWEWSTLFGPLSDRQWLGYLKKWSMVNNTVNNGAPAPNTSYIHSASNPREEGANRDGTSRLHCYNTVRTWVKAAGQLSMSKIHQCQLTSGSVLSD